LLRELPVFGIVGAPSQTKAEWTLYFATENLQSSLGAAVELGATVQQETALVDDAGHGALCVDPTGARFGLWQPAAHPGAGVVGEPGSLIWYELYTRDGRRARDFYSQLLGASSTDPPGSEYVILHADEKPVFAIVQVDEDWPESMHPHFMVYVAVEHASAAVSRVRSAGGRVHLAPFETPFGQVAIVEDKEGGLFSVVEPPSSRPPSPKSRSAKSRPGGNRSRPR
jgi:predicted enzyme related to lactoylglutathione lyase